MVKYEITFKFDYDLDDIYKYQGDDDYKIETNILDVDVTNVDKYFNDSNKDEAIKEINDWFFDNDENINKIISIDYECDLENGYIYIVLDKEIDEDLNSFANEVIDYLFQIEYPKMYINYYGVYNGYKMDWGGHDVIEVSDKHEIDENETYDIKKYTDIVIKKVN